MKNCKTCSNAIFDGLWGEHKCRVSQHRVYDSETMSDCPDYKKGTPTESKKNEKEDDE